MPKVIDPRIEPEICKAYEETPSSHKLAKKFGLGQSTVLFILRRNNVKLKKRWRKEWDPEIAREIRVRYENGESIKSLSLEFKFLWSEIRTRLVEWGVTVRTLSEVYRKHTLNETAFDEVTEDSAYWVGFLMADGYIVTGRKSQRDKLSGVGLGVKLEDKDHIRKFLDFLGADHTIGHTAKTMRGSGKRHLGARVELLSAPLAIALSRYGVVAKKTHVARVQQLEMNRDFWRGVIDGDGCIHIKKDGKIVLLVTGSTLLLNQFQAFMKTHVPSCGASVRHDERSPETIATYEISRVAATTMIRILYHDCKTALARKESLARSIMDDAAMMRYGRRRPDSTQDTTLPGF